jgi:hypothetical protein
MGVVVDMGFTQVLVLHVLVRQMRVAYLWMIMFVLMFGGQVFPLAHDGVRALAAVVRYMRMLFIMD